LIKKVTYLISRISRAEILEILRSQSLSYAGEMLNCITRYSDLLWYISSCRASCIIQSSEKSYDESTVAPVIYISSDLFVIVTTELVLFSDVFYRLKHDRKWIHNI